MISVLGFLIILAPLVVVHEFGHYIFARIFRVKAEVFSIGFGPRIWSKQLGETELRVSVVPLGGYVKLLGEEQDRKLSSSELKRSLHKQAPWKRFFIFLGGPLFNFIFAILVFMAILAIGEQVPSNLIGRVVAGSEAARAGLQSGDRILKVDGATVAKFEDIVTAIHGDPGRTVKFDVQRVGQANPVQIKVKTRAEKGFTVYGEQTDVGVIEGMLPLPRALDVGVSNPESAAAKAGVVTGDKVIAFEGQPLRTWEELESRYAAFPHSTIIRLKLKKANGDEYETRFVKPAAGESLGEAWGLYSSELFVEKTVAKSPAEASGLKAGDRLIAVGSLNVQSFFSLKDAVQKSGETDGKVSLKWEREGKILSATLTPTSSVTRDPLLKKVTQFTVGVVPMLNLAEPDTIVERTWNPFLLVGRATERMVVLSWRNFVSIKKMFSGDVSTSTLGGPIMIGKIAGESLSRGLIAFLTTMAILSIGLGVLNILPVPVLDGGHLLLLGIEVVRGRPLSVRQMELIQTFGLVLILALMGLVLHNDLTRAF